MRDAAAIALLAFTLGALVTCGVLWFLFKGALGHILHCARCKQDWMEMFEKGQNKIGRCWLEQFKSKEKGENT